MDLDTQTASYCWNENQQENAAHSQTVTTGSPAHYSEKQRMFPAAWKNFEMYMHLIYSSLVRMHKNIDFSSIIFSFIVHGIQL